MKKVNKNLDRWLEKVTKKTRGYPHFDLNPSPKSVVKYITSPDKISHHQFFPLIKFSVVENKYIKSESGNSNKEKKREICYASHKDSLIYSWYSTLLEDCYEQLIQNSKFGNSVVAYRKLDGKSNIDFAQEVFENIKTRETSTVITIDVKHFFDTLDHSFVKETWKKVLVTNNLPPDHYKIFRSITKFAFVEREKLYDEFGIKSDDHKQLICTLKEFHTRVRKKGLINFNKDTKGIPQGTPISALISNIYMLPFDMKMYKYLERKGAFYRRYSDDIIIVCKVEDEEKVLSMLMRNLKERKLELNPKKTEIVTFKRNNNNELRGYSKNGNLANLQYLGFYFNGEDYYIRSSSISRYYRKLENAVKFIRRKAFANKKNKKLFKRKIYEQYSHLGKRNFMTYVKLASKKMSSKNIRLQLKNHMPILLKAMKSKKSS